MPTAAPSSRERLQKVLAAAGVASRRSAERLIQEGRVSVNGSIVRELGTRVNPRTDRIRLDGRRVNPRPPQRYYLLHKPRGVVSTTHDPQARRTVVDLTSDANRLFPVGRLDAASEGLVLLTNDGEAAQRLLHPSYRVPRTYRVSVDGRIQASDLRALRNGLHVDGHHAAVRDARLLQASETRSVVEVVLIEGRRHQIRKMFDAIEHPVRRLVRTRFGPLSLRGLAPGESRPLSREEREAVRKWTRNEPARPGPQPDRS